MRHTYTYTRHLSLSSSKYKYNISMVCDFIHSICTVAHTVHSNVRSKNAPATPPLGAETDGVYNCDFMSCFMGAIAALSVCHASKTTHMTQDMDNARTQPRSWSNIEDAPRVRTYAGAPFAAAATALALRLS